jgi:FKBP-type peptidyl-prolyl cis-trans isomerase SlyD
MGYQVGPGTHVKLGYEVFDGDGEHVDGSNDAPVSVVFGYGELLPALEDALAGMTAGEAKSVVLRPKNAYGPRRPGAVLEVDRSEFPPEVAPGDRYELENAEGGVLVLKVLDVDDSRVVLDANHPLAGQNVRFELRVLEVRPATSEESKAAEARLTGDPGVLAAGPPALIAPERLIRGQGKRYEHGLVPKPNGEKS